MDRSTLFFVCILTGSSFYHAYAAEQEDLLPPMADISSVEDEDRDTMQQDMMQDDTMQEDLAELDEQEAALLSIDAEAELPEQIDAMQESQPEESLPPSTFVDDAAMESEVTETETPATVQQDTVPEVAESVMTAKPEEDVPQVQKEQASSIGITTVDLKEPRGNWLFKRIWWERSEERYEKIRSVVDQIWEFRVEFFMKRADVDKNILDPFYLKIGFGQGEFKEIVKELIDRLESDRVQEGFLSEQERALLADLQEEKDALNQLKKDIDSIVDRDRAIDETLSRLMEQINVARQNERDAWANFKEIARILDDRAAQELFDKIEIAWRNVKNIQKYINDELARYFNMNINTMKTEVDRVLNILQKFRERGINLKERADRIDQAERATEVEPIQESQEDDDAYEPVQKGWLEWAGDLILGGLNSIWNGITYPFRFLYSLVAG